jgi:hypothetical protein
MSTANKVIREAAKKKGVKLWEIALFLCVSEATITRMMRVELAPEKSTEILTAIDRIAAEKAVSAHG